MVKLGLGDNSKVISVLSKKQVRWDFEENSEMIFSCFYTKYDPLLELSWGDCSNEGSEYMYMVFMETCKINPKISFEPEL